MTEQGVARREEVVAHVTRRVCDVFSVGPGEVAESTVILDIEGADSVKMMRLLGKVESHFDLQLMTEDLPIARTVADLVDQVILIRAR